MLGKILITLSVPFFLIIIPLLEINDSHVFNASWPAHARFHEVWQLATNMGIGLLCLWLAWAQDRVRLAGLLVILVMGGVLLAHVLGGFYGGSVSSGNLTKTVFGLDIPVFAATVVTLMAAVAIAIETQRASTLNNAASPLSSK